MLPTFLGIGAMKSGSSWVMNVIDTHPEVFAVPWEVHFFNRSYEKGENWYRQQFRRAGNGDRYAAVGEFTPVYLFYPEIPERIAKTVPDVRLLVVLRDPIDRIYSEFRSWCRLNNRNDDFADYLGFERAAVERGYYSRQIKRYLEHFPAERITCLCFEQVSKDTKALKAQLSHFLGVDPEGFRIDPSMSRNATYRPRFRRVYSALVKTQKRLARAGVHNLPQAARAMGLHKVFRAGEENRGFPPMTASDLSYLQALYGDEANELRKTIGVDFSEWWGTSTGGPAGGERQLSGRDAVNRVGAG